MFTHCFNHKGKLTDIVHYTLHSAVAWAIIPFTFSSRSSFTSPLHPLLSIKLRTHEEFCKHMWIFSNVPLEILPDCHRPPLRPSQAASSPASLPPAVRRRPPAEASRRPPANHPTRCSGKHFSSKFSIKEKLQG